jgi:hypothetical protein
MPTIVESAREFLSQETIAVAGVSSTRPLPANTIYRTLRSQGHRVYAISATSSSFDGEPCYPSIQALPTTPDGVVIVTRPAVTLELVQQCVAAGVTRVWMHDMRGSRPKIAKSSGEAMSSVSAEAVRLCQANGITVIPGCCPLQFVGDIGHKCMRWMFQVMGDS